MKEPLKERTKRKQEMTRKISSTSNRTKTRATSALRSSPIQKRATTKKNYTEQKERSDVNDGRADIYFTPWKRQTEEYTHNWSLPRSISTLNGPLSEKVDMWCKSFKEVGLVGTWCGWPKLTLVVISWRRLCGSRTSCWLKTEASRDEKTFGDASGLEKLGVPVANDNGHTNTIQVTTRSNIWPVWMPTGPTNRWMWELGGSLTKKTGINNRMRNWFL